MKNESFYASGLNFSCIRCSACCRYDSGFVYLSENDLNNLITELKMDKNKVVEKYCRWVNDWKGNEVLSLKEKSNKDCILWENGCTIYNERPLQCIAFPFWESILNSKESWKIAASTCPGMNNGTLHSKDVIDNFKKKRTEFPIIKRGEL